jgi:hypothetical protein
MLSWSTLPIGYLLGVWAASVLEPAMALDGEVAAGWIGSLLGVGPGRGIGVVLVLAGLSVLTIALVVMSRRRFWNFDTIYPDDVPDDLLGLREADVPDANSERARVLQEG